MSDIFKSINALKIRKLLIKIIGVYQILFGLLGLTVSFIQGFDLLLSKFIYFFVVVFFFSFGVYSGILLLTRNLKKGISLSTINQFFQIAQFKILGNGLEYVAGIYFAVGFSDSPALNLQYKLAAYKSSCFISLMTGDDEIKFMLNIVAIAILIYLAKVQSKLHAVL